MKGELIVQGTTFEYAVYRGDRTSETCMYVQNSRQFEKLYSLDMLEVEDRGEDDLSDIHREFNENIIKSRDWRYEVKMPWAMKHKVD